MSTFHYMLRFATRPCSALRQITNILRPSLNINSPRLHATGSPKRLADAKPLSFARPTPFNHRLNKLIAHSKPFRRSYSSPTGHGTMPASYKSTKRAVRTLILINTGVFLTWAYASGNARQTNDTQLLHYLVKNFLLTEENLSQGRYHTMITSAFSHTNLFHFGFNMFVLWTFGGILAYLPFIGARHIYLLALTGSFASSSAWLIHQRSKATPAPKTISRSWNPFSDTSAPSRTRKTDALLGASGFIMATVSLSACLMPFAPMMMMGVVPMPLYAVAMAYAALDLYLLDSEQSRTAHSAHLGGLAFGIVYYLALLRKKGGVWQLISRRTR